MKSARRKSISEATRSAILEAAWTLIADKGQLDVSQAEIAQAAGVSRQTVFYAFGDRAGLLLAMVRHRDHSSEQIPRMLAAAQDGADPETLVAYAMAWLDYLPVIYPVGILLDAASLSDPAAAEAWNSRMRSGLLGGFRRVTGRLAEAGQLGDRDPDRLADEIWSLCHPTAWRQLVVEGGWSAEEFRASREAAIRRLVRTD